MAEKKSEEKQVARWDPFADFDALARWSPFRELGAFPSRLSRLLLETAMVERILGAKFPEEVTRVIAAEEAALGDSGKVAG